MGEMDKILNCGISAKTKGKKKRKIIKNYWNNRSPTLSMSSDVLHEYL